jgi:hypothetical protein
MRGPPYLTNRIPGISARDSCLVEPRHTQLEDDRLKGFCSSSTPSGDQLSAHQPCVNANPPPSKWHRCLGLRLERTRATGQGGGAAGREERSDPSGYRFGPSPFVLTDNSSHALGIRTILTYKHNTHIQIHIYFLPFFLHVPSRHSLFELFLAKKPLNCYTIGLFYYKAPFARLTNIFGEFLMRE